MAKAVNQFETMAAEASKRIDAARASGQLSLFPGDVGGEVEQGASGRGKGKAMSTLREILRARGCHMPEDVLANIAGLDDPEGPIMACLKKAEAVALAIYGHGQVKAEVRLNLFQQFYAAAIRAGDALLPYGLAKVTPDAAPVQAVQVVMMPSGPSQPQPVTIDHAGQQPGQPAPERRRMAPPPLPSKSE